MKSPKRENIPIFFEIFLVGKTFYWSEKTWKIFRHVFYRLNLYFIGYFEGLIPHIIYRKIM
ncbi:MAG: hypothetical protein ACD_78C00143G0002 [uncultured bacterium (gcode 4)]|uniref:Uncharacterized protein n=1 Tax=uncultured bacterium (gcode 4) TaxID=1234023 RepID=K1YD40_9BACT|nr:MAG: hypothetical protein ACD_78C00143G0002 [uncultured bacterium (gcode 4)]